MTKSRQSADFAAGGFYAGKNKIINGDFGIWQRGTSVTNATNTYTADRWKVITNGSPTTMTTSRQTFTPGTAPVEGYESSYFFRNLITTVGTLGDCDIQQFIENVQTLAGQTATISFWAKADAARTLTLYIGQNFGSGGSGTVTVNPSGTTFSLTTSWQRFTATYSIPSISGKTVGTSSYLFPVFRQAVAAGSTLDIWGVQFEQGSTATAFQTATGTIQGELSACQRYYWRANSASNVFTLFALGYSDGPNSALMCISIPSYMRVFPTSIDFSNTAIQEAIGGALNAVSSFTISAGGATSPNNNIVFQANTSGLTNGRTARLIANNSSSAFIGFNAEL